MILPPALGGAAPAAPADTPPPFPIRIVSPAAGDLLVGRSEVAVETTPAPGASILKMELFVDDILVATLLDPPWRFSWDAGESVRPRAIRVRAWASDGSTASARLVTRAVAGVQRAQVTLVEIYATVRDSRGAYLMNLDKKEFSILESGQAREIALFTADRKPARLILLMDTSGSMRLDERLVIAQEAAAGFVEKLEPEDQAGLITFSDTPKLVHPPSGNHRAVESAILSATAGGGTALYDAIVMAVDQLKEHEGRKAIILLSDGRDESHDGLGPGSIATYEEALDALLRSETAIYVIGTGEKIAEEYDYNRRRTLGDLLGTLASRSGGRAFFVKRASKLKDAYSQIEDELRHQYTLGFYPPAGLEPKARKGDRPGWRPLQVKVSRNGVKVTAREGYFAH